MLFVFGSGVEVHLADFVAEFGSGSVDALEKFCGDEVLVVEFSDFLLGVSVDMVERIVLVTVDLLKEGPFFLSSLRLWLLSALGEVERQSKHLFAVGGVQSNSIDGGFPVFECSGLLGELRLEGGGDVARTINRVDQLLQFNRVAVTFSEVGIIAVSDVLKTVNLTKVVENVVHVGSSALHSEDLGKVSVLRNLLHHLVKELRLRQWIISITGQIVQGLLLLGDEVASA